MDKKLINLKSKKKNIGKLEIIMTQRKIIWVIYRWKFQSNILRNRVGPTQAEHNEQSDSFDPRKLSIL